MPLVAVFSRDREVTKALDKVLQGAHETASARTWRGFSRMVRERPASASIVDLTAFGEREDVVREIVRFRTAFPRHGVIVLDRDLQDPHVFFHLGKEVKPELLVLSVDAARSHLLRSIAYSMRGGVTAHLVRTISGTVSREDLVVVRHAADSVHRSLSADAFASEIGLSRPFLSERLKAAGLPSTGHLLTWARLLHAGHWLSEPGRSGESVSRQLEYANGSTFRRALRNYVGATPSEIRADGGLAPVLDRFLEVCGRSRIDPPRRAASVA